MGLKAQEYRSPKRLIGDVDVEIVYRYPTRDEGFDYHMRGAAIRSQQAGQKPADGDGSDEATTLEVLKLAVEIVTPLVTGLIVNGEPFAGTADAMQALIREDWRFTSYLYDDSAWLFRFTPAGGVGRPGEDGGAAKVPAGG